MKHFFPLMALFLLSAPVLRADTVLLGPTNLRISETGEFSWVDQTPAPEAFDNFWAYRYYPADKKLTGKGVKVAVADSGITSHPEFNGKHIMGQDFTMSGGLSDLKNHGTGVAGIIGARGVRFIGIAPEASIVVYKIDDGSRLIGPQAAAAAVNALLKYNEEHPDDKIAVLNLSYGVSGGGFAALTNAINRAHDSGVTIVSPAGNYGFPGVFYPGTLSTVIAVGALASDGASVYPQSSYGPEVEFIAPGDRVYTAASDGGYTLMSGTSAAAGFVSAAAALAVEGFKKKNGRYPTVDEVKTALKAAAVKVPGVPDIAQGSGMIDVRKLEKQFAAENEKK
ncbi:S8 family serine peptidase [Candidatus Avelusimicrobium alvi]|uniref:S8 family peptidase n=1 Tax=Candidatus Avelusimicrobium alvi TaxID=3416221 RepID=UPI003D0A0BE6